MSDLKTDYTEEGLGRLLDQFADSTNLRALASSYLDQVQAFEDAANPLFDERDILQATGDRLDGFGAIVNVARSGRSDADYRLRLRAELAVLTSQGSAEDLIAVARLLLLMADPPPLQIADYYPKTVYMRPVDTAITQAAALVAGPLFRRTVSAATEMLFVYSQHLDATTYTLSSQGATVETSSSLGLASVPTYEGWDFDTAIVLAGIGSGEFRFNNTDPALATQVFIHDVDVGATDQSALLAALPEDVMALISTPKGVFVYVTGVTDNTGTFTLDITNVVKIGSTFGDGNLANLWSGSTGGKLSGTA